MKFLKLRLLLTLLAFALVAWQHGLFAALAAGLALGLAFDLSLRGAALCATWTNLDDEIFANSALEGFVATLVPFNSFSTNFSAEAVDHGANVLVPLIGALTATTFAGSYAVCGGEASVITVPINRHKIVHVGQNDLSASNSSRANLETFGFQQGAALAIAVLQDVTTLWTTANFGLATAVSIVDFGLTQIRSGRKLLRNAKVPMNPLSMILDVDPFDNLLGISNFLQVNLSGSDETLRDARVGRALGFNIYESNGLPGTNSVMGFVGHASAIAVAMRYLRPQDGHTYVEARPVTHLETGATFGLRKHYDNNTGTLYTNLEANFGSVAGITNAGRLLARKD